jgi:hypothetical protein
MCRDIDTLNLPAGKRRTMHPLLPCQLPNFEQGAYMHHSGDWRIIDYQDGNPNEISPEFNNNQANAD